MDMMKAEAICQLGLYESAQAIRAGEISSQDLAQALLDRVSGQAHLNAFVSISDHVLDDARNADRKLKSGEPVGALHGVPIALKDNIDTVGLPTTGGTPALATHRPHINAAIADKLFSAGAILLGKNTMQELAFGVTCRQTPQGPVRNPYDLDAIPGGSSGGTAVAVAAGMASAGIGTDTGGSVRVPAALCGLAGFRPSVGRWSTKGILPISHTRDTAGPIARSVRDLGLLDSVVTGDAPLAALDDLSGVRLGLPAEYFWEGLDPEVERLCRAAVELMRDAGATIVPADLKAIGERNAAVSFVVALHEPRADISAYLESSGSALTFDAVIASVLGSDVRDIVQSMQGAAAAERAYHYNEVMAHLRPQLVAAYADVFATHRLDALIFPTTPLPACPVGDSEEVTIGTLVQPAFGAFIRNTDPGSNAGIPGVTINAGFTSRRLPVGLALDGPVGCDLDLLRTCQKIEQLIQSYIGNSRCLF